MRQASIIIDRHALTHNLSQVKAALRPQTKVLAMVKANAYGHGIEDCLSAFEEADGLGVACFSEAIKIRKLGWQKVLVLIEGVFSKSEWQQALQSECQCVIHHHEQVEWALNQRPRTDSASNTIWLKVNTGMNRLGFEPDQLVEVAKQLTHAGYHLILTSHFANADVVSHPSNANQIAIFKESLQHLQEAVDPSIQASLCNSAGIINFAHCHFDWVRPGIMLYGSTPLEGVSAKQLNLRPVMTFESSIMAIHHIKAGTPVGYGSRYVADKPMVKGIVSIGYGDGYPRVVDDTAWVNVLSNNVLSNNVLINKQTQSSETIPSELNALTNIKSAQRCPVIGRVAMDMIAIDLTDARNPKIGDKVILWGDASAGDPSVDDIAKAANTLGYELLCRMTERPSKQVL